MSRKGKVVRKQGKSRKGRVVSTIIIVVILLAGLSLLLYPTVADYINAKRYAGAVASYASEVANLDREEYDRLWNNAVAYNKTLAIGGNVHELSDTERENYGSQLSIMEGAAIGYIEIPSIDCVLPIYHGTEDSVLQMGVGHLEWSSLPVGGESTHCVLSSHRGLPSARLFTDLDELMVGDIFMLRTLDEVLTYEVDRILIVLPNETESLNIVEGQDLCTLVTCTPYGINTHRLLVRGHRIPNITEGIRITADAQQIEPKIVAPFVAVPILIILLIWLMLANRKNKKNAGYAKQDAWDAVAALIHKNRQK